MKPLRNVDDQEAEEVEQQQAATSGRSHAKHALHSAAAVFGARGRLGLTGDAPHFDRFVAWVDSGKYAPGQLCGWPDFIIEWTVGGSCDSCRMRAEDDCNDPECWKCVC